MSNTGDTPFAAIEQTEIHHAEQGGSQHDEPSSPRAPTRSFSQDTLVSSGNYGPVRRGTRNFTNEPEHDQPHHVQQVEMHSTEETHQYDETSQLTDGPIHSKSIARKPVPGPVQRGRYSPLQQNDMTPSEKSPHQYSEDSSEQQKGRTIITPFAAYGLALLIVFFGSLGFWIQGRRTTLYFSKKNTKWMFDNPKTTTMLWTSVAALLAWCTLWLHACAVSLMARKLIIKGAKISTIESWVKLSNNGALLDRRRPFLSLYTALAAIATAALTVGFAGLLTPVSLVRFNRIQAAEIDITRDDFKAWYADKDNRTFTGCMWYTYKNSENGKEYTFPTCPFQDDNSLVLQAGRAAVETGFGLNSITKIGDVNFNGTTGGTLPIGLNGFQAFDTMKYYIDEGEFPNVYNYSTLLQGSTIDVSCEETDSSPITVEVLDTIKTSAPVKTNMHVRYNLSAAESGGRCQWDYNQDFIVPEGGNLMTFMCGTKDETPSNIPPAKRLPVAPFYIFFRPFGDYESGARGLQLQNVTCKVEPLMTINNVTYDSVTNDFTSRVVEKIEIPSLAPTDFEAMDAIYQVFWYGISKQGNIIADTIISLRHQNEEESNQPMYRTFENILRGFYEIEMTSLRLYYSANSPPGSRQIPGVLTHFRMGYNGSIEALYALGPLALVVVMGLGYLIWGLWVGGEMFEFNPTRASSLLVASSQGGLARLNLERIGIPQAAGKYPDESSLQHVKVRFGELPHGVLGLGLQEETKDRRSSSDSQRPNVV